MDASKYLGDHYVNAEDIREGPEPYRVRIAVVKRHPRLDRLVLVFEDGDMLTLNPTSIRVLTKNYAANTDQWIGRDIELFVKQIEIKEEGKEPKLQDCVFVRAVSPAIPAAERKKPPQSGLDDEIPF